MKNQSAPQRVYMRALCLVRQWRQGKIRPRRTFRHGYLSISVTHYWRLLSKDEGQHWELLSHAEYDHHLRRRLPHKSHR